jgi:hypothetical protein
LAPAHPKISVQPDSWYRQPRAMYDEPSGRLREMLAFSSPSVPFPRTDAPPLLFLFEITSPDASPKRQPNCPNSHHESRALYEGVGNRSRPEAQMYKTVPYTTVDHPQSIGHDTVGKPWKISFPSRTSIRAGFGQEPKLIATFKRPAYRHRDVTLGHHRVPWSNNRGIGHILSACFAVNFSLSTPNAVLLDTFPSSPATYSCIVMSNRDRWSGPPQTEQSQLHGFGIPNPDHRKVTSSSPRSR